MQVLVRLIYENKNEARTIVRFLPIHAVYLYNGRLYLMERRRSRENALLHTFGFPYIAEYVAV